ncbi:MAG TPA: transcription antitermination factor NusB [Thermohalobaculum sp.]|nr:transcription antitermination factor NusB [Thermohalobaculum sp.]
MTRDTGIGYSGGGVPGLAARQGALALIGAVLDRGEMLNESLLEEAGIEADGAERAEARSLAELTLRRLGQIDAALKPYVQRMPKPPVSHALRLMAAELLFAGTAPHAAVDLGVRLVKYGRGTSRFSGLTNAVGRRLADEGPEILAQQNPARLNLPGWLAKRLTADWGNGVARAIARAHLTPPRHDLTLRDGSGPAAEELGAALLPTGTFRLADQPQLTTLPGFGSGAWWVQDAAAALPARLIPEPRGKRILDICAAPGGKTLQLAAMGAVVTALDRSPKRLERLAENLARTGLSAVTLAADALEWNPEAPFDVILLDAPCSATGTIRRHPDLPHRQGEIDIEALTALQTRLLDRAAGWLVPGGILVFCTCSLFKAEGEDQAAAFLERHPEFSRLPLAPGEAEIPAKFVTPEGDLRTRPDFWPELGGLDGFFAARFQLKS